jgi:hypothetical protein
MIPTPGQWFVHKLESRTPFNIEVRALAGTAYRTIALLRSLTYDRADAHLIAAAKDMLGELEQAVAEKAHGVGCKALARNRPDACDCWLSDAVHVIAAAKGEDL